MDDRSGEGLVPLVTCAGGCGFRGDPRSFSLCSSCHKTVLQGAEQISDAEVLEFALGKAGLRSCQDARLAASFERLHAVAPPAPEPDLPFGCEAWRTIIRPLTQYDEYPQRGTSACTYICSICALWACARRVPSGEDWARCIVLGVRAFHAARAADAANCSGNVSPFTAVPHIRTVAAEALLTLPLDAPLYRETVLLLARPEELGDPDAGVLAGHCTDFDFGKPGLAVFFKQALLPGARSAVVVVRPPETYCIAASPDGVIALRDSHRRVQLDFTDLVAFERWLYQDRSFFASTPAVSLDSNCVGLYTLASLPGDSAQCSEQSRLLTSTRYRVVNPEGVNVRSSTGHASLKLKTYAEGTTFDVLEQHVDERGISRFRSPDGWVADRVVVGGVVLIERVTTAVPASADPASATPCKASSAGGISAAVLAIPCGTAEAGLRKLGCSVEQAAEAAQQGPEAIASLASNFSALSAPPQLEEPQPSSAAAEVLLPAGPSPETVELHQSKLVLGEPAGVCVVPEKHCLESAAAPAISAAVAEPAEAIELLELRAEVSRLRAEAEVRVATSSPPRELADGRDCAGDHAGKSNDDEDKISRNGDETPFCRQASRLRLEVELNQQMQSVEGEKTEVELDLQFVLACMPVRRDKSAKTSGTLSLRSAPQRSAGHGGKDSSPATWATERWFQFFDRDGDGRLSKADVFTGLCDVLSIEANPKLVRPVRQLLSACWEDWDTRAEGFVTKEAFVRPNVGLADTLKVNLAEPMRRLRMASNTGGGQSPHIPDNCAIC